MADLYEKKGKEKKKIKSNEITAVHRTLIAAKAVKEIIKERDQYSRLFEETAAACRLSNIELQIVDMRCQK